MLSPLSGHLYHAEKVASGGSILATGKVSPYSPVCLNPQIFYSGEDMRSPETEEEETSELTQAVPTLLQTAQWVEVDAKPLYLANQTL